MAGDGDVLSIGWVQSCKCGNVKIPLGLAGQLVGYEGA